MSYRTRRPDMSNRELYRSGVCKCGLEFICDKNSWTINERPEETKFFLMANCSECGSEVELTNHYVDVKDFGFLNEEKKEKSYLYHCYAESTINNIAMCGVISINYPVDSDKWNDVIANVSLKLESRPSEILIKSFSFLGEK